VTIHPTWWRTRAPTIRGDSVTAMRTMSTKVPLITAFFWVIKVLTTAMGETTSDYLAHRYGPLVAAPFGALALLVALAVQFSLRRYVAAAYWFAVAMVAVFGTMVADGLHVELKIPYPVSTTLFAISLAVIFYVWNRVEGTLSIHSINTTRREFFYWCAVMATFALGTAAGDFTAHSLGLGYLASGIVFAVIFAIPGIGLWKLHWNAIFCFWFAYVVTRPLGASFADWLGVSKYRGGLGLGTGLVSVVLAGAIVVLVGYLAITKRDVPAS
jgi:uncharacterized membrane-anchored protein